MTTSHDKILEAVLGFNWGNYGFDELDELASNDPGIGIFDNLADHIYVALENRLS